MYDDLHHRHGDRDEYAVEGHPHAPRTTRPPFVTKNEHYWRYEVRSQAPTWGQLDGYEAGAWNDYGANAGVAIKNLILSTWARPL